MRDQVELKNNAYILTFEYDPDKIAMLKSMVPYSERKWDASRRQWIVDTRHRDALGMIFPDALIPAADDKRVVTDRVISIRYLGKTKDRGDGESSALGFCDGGWTVVMPERVLREWFEGVDLSATAGVSTYYGLLGVPKGASKDEIKTGYRRAAKQWHPDVCSEPNAKEMFLRIKQAYETLSNDNKKARYDVGLMLTKPSDEAKPEGAYGYRSPLRCGVVSCRGEMVIGKFVVERILAWDDIANEKGQSLVTNWVMGEDKPREQWV